jgi:outer membrane lipoprotein-sorting protein
VIPRLALWTWLALAAVSSPAQIPESDPRTALVAMGERLMQLQSYQARISRVTELTVSAEVERSETLIDFAIERPNRVALRSAAPEGRMEVVSDGERLAIWSEELGLMLDREAPATLPEIFEVSEGLAAEGLAIGGLLFAEDPAEAITAEYDIIHDLGGMHLEGALCHLIGLEQRDGLKMVLWLDAETLMPRQVTLDATATLRDTLTAQGINSLGARATVIEIHRDVILNAEDLEFHLLADTPAEPE